MPGKTADIKTKDSGKPPLNPEILLKLLHCTCTSKGINNLKGKLFLFSLVFSDSRKLMSNNEGDVSKNAFVTVISTRLKLQTV